MTGTDADKLDGIENELAQLAWVMRLMSAGHEDSAAMRGIADYIDRIAYDLDRMTDGVSR